MQAKTYSVGSDGRARRLDNFTLPWINISPSLTIPGISTYDLNDVETDPNDGSKVFAVGVGSPLVSAFGIYVSTNGGTSWLVPGGDYQTNVGANNLIVWNEVCVVNSNVIAVCGNNGYVAISTDGGFTFNLTTQVSVLAPAITNNIGGLHFLSATVGVITTDNHVLKTIDGGLTWTVLNSGTPLTGAPDFQIGRGIHISQDLLTIIALSGTAVYRSTDGGLNFTVSYQWGARNGLHLTWTDDQNLWIFGDNGERARTSDAGASWTVLNVFTPQGPEQYAGHFYQGNNGYYSSENLTLVTTDGSVSSVLSDTYNTKYVLAVWTWFDPSTCYRLISCIEGVEDIIVTNDLSASVGQVIEVCPTDLPVPQGTSGSGSSGIPFDQVPPVEEPSLLFAPQFDLVDCCGIQPTVTVTNNLFPYVNGVVYIPVLGNTCWTPTYSGGATPEALNVDLTGATYYNECEICNEDHGCNFTPVLTVCGCYTIEVAESCQQAITLLNIGTIYTTCNDCAVKCYLLTDCTNDQNIIKTNFDLSIYIDGIIKLKDCPDTCWLVTLADDCEGFECISEVTDTFKTCLECLPKVIPTPFELHSRRIKPGYYTPGCPPEYTEKVNCNYGEQMYDKMLAARYGLTQCCAEDLQKWDIKKSLLDLNAIYDPELCKCVIPPKCCPPTHVQAFIIPPYVPPPVIDCFCWTIRVIKEAIGIQYLNCDGQVTEDEILAPNVATACSSGDVIVIQEDPGSVYEITQSETLCSNEEPCVVPCSCYKVSVQKGPITIQWTGCNSISQTQIINSKAILWLCCSVAPVVIQEDPDSDYIIELLPGDCATTQDCIAADCLPPSRVTASLSFPDNCTCYQIEVKTEGCNVTVKNCKTGLNVVYSGLQIGIYYLCSNGIPTSNCFNTNVKELGICSSGFCVPSLKCNISEDCCCFNIVASEEGNIMYIDCDGALKILNLIIGLNKVCAQAVYYGVFTGVTSAVSVGACDETCVIV